MKKKIFKTVFRIFGFLIVSLLVGYCIFLINAQFVLHEQLPMIGGYGNAVVLSGSMEPNISVNDLLIIKECDSYEADDIVTFVDSYNDLVTHRIVKIDGSQVTTQGDANNVADPSFDASRIKGKVIAVLPGVGYIVNFIRNPFCVVCIVILALILMERSYAKERKKKDKNIETVKAEIEALRQEIESESESNTPQTENK